MNRFRMLPLAAALTIGAMTGGAVAQGVVDEAGNGGSIARSGKAVGKTPVLERVGGGAAPLLDIGQDLDGGRKPRRRGHRITRWTTTNSHIASRATTPNRKMRKRLMTLLLPVCTNRCANRLAT